MFELIYDKFQITGRKIPNTNLDECAVHSCLVTARLFNKQVALPGIIFVIETGTVFLGVTL